MAEKSYQASFGTDETFARLVGGDGIGLVERSEDPADPPEGCSFIWQSDGTGTGSDGDIYIKTTAGGSTTTTQLVSSGGTTVISEALQIGVDGTGYDVTFYGDTSGHYLLWDESEDTLKLVGGATVDLSGKLNLGLNGGAESASGLLMGVGTSGNPATTANADDIFAEFRTQSTATSGDSRGLYWRHDINGAAGGGEALRAFSKVTAAASTVRGAHISIDLSTAGSVSGFGAGVDAQVLYGDTSYSNTLTAVNAELYAAGSSTAITAGTGSFFRIVAGGDATGLADIESNSAFISFANAAGSGKIVDSDITALTGKAGLRVYVGGALYGYIPIVTGS